MPCIRQQVVELFVLLCVLSGTAPPAKAEDPYAPLLEGTDTYLTAHIACNGEVGLAHMLGCRDIILRGPNPCIQYAALFISSPFMSSSHS
jgi:hypothetical protein